MATGGESTGSDVRSRIMDTDGQDNLQEMVLKRDKATAKSNFTRSRNQLLNLLDLEELASRQSVKEACDKLNIMSDKATHIMTQLSELYMAFNAYENYSLVVSEMEKLELEFTAAHDAAREYLGNISAASDALSIDLTRKLHITHDTVQQKNIAFRNQVDTSPVSHGTYNYNRDENSLKYNGAGQPHGKESYLSEDIQNTWKDQKADTDQPFKDDKFNDYDIKPQATTYNSKIASIGQDLWKQLKRVEIPIFSGNKRSYQGWKAAFVACIDNAPATPEYKLLQLRQYLSGEALSVIENLGHSATAYEAAKDRLERKYGGKRRQIAIYLDELDQFRQVRTGNAKDLEQFADLLDIALINLREAGQHQELGDGTLYTKLQRKLPESLLARYHRWVFENNKTESVVSLRCWIIQEAEFQTIASETVLGFTVRTDNFESKKRQYQPTFFGDLQDDKNKNRTRLCKVCGLQHGIWMCPDLIKMEVQERWATAKRLNLCFRCLSEGHRGKLCLKTRVCDIEGCKYTHNRLLHKYNNSQTNKTQHNENIPKTTALPLSRFTVENSDPRSFKEGNPLQTTMVSSAHISAGFLALRTVPVVLKNGNRKMKVNALLDDASNKTYINADVAAELGLHGLTKRVNVNVLNGQVETFETTPVTLGIESTDGKVGVQVTAYTTNRVTGDMPVIDWSKHAFKWQHLKDIEFPKNDTRPIVDVLIGIDCADLHAALQEVRGIPGEPIARLTPLGWTCIGYPESVNDRNVQTNFACTYFVKDQSEIETLNKNLRKFWEIEEVYQSEGKTIVNIDEKLALQTVQKSMKYENGMYEVAIPWKACKPDLPDNYEMALRRLHNTERKLQKQPDIEKAYRQCIDQYVEKGYVRKVTENERNTSKWYLPHFPVIRLDKDTTKTRIVFDASAKCEGISLNDAINQGPKLQRDLLDVLLRFRKYPIAIVCDIAEMYLRIGIATDDRPYHRFLWRGMSMNKRPDVFEFTRVVFGVNSSPFQAQFVSQTHAEKLKTEFPMAAETVLKSTYMDDSMDSVIDEDRAIALYKELSQLWSGAGMHARKWISNSAKVLKEIPIVDRKSEVDLEKGQLPSAKTLGVWWIADKDIFTFRENAPDKDMTYTKRNFLKKIAALFDPIGLLAPFTIKAKILLQDMWITGVDWDEELDESLKNAARAWFSELHELTEIGVPRCLQDKERNVETVTLHTFVDASEKAFGAVVYARYTYKDGSVSCNIVAAKTRVAPNIASSIPRLELNGAIIGVRLATVVSKALELSMDQSVFWSDSANVLWWIRGRSRDYKPFVANRVGEIHSNTIPQQWRYIPTDRNPADFLSRGMKAVDLIHADTWWKGPEFLRQFETNWPVNKLDIKIAGNNEMKTAKSLQKKDSGSLYINSSSEKDACTAYIAVIENNDNAFPLELRRFSSWLKIKRVQAWVNRFIENCLWKNGERIVGELKSDEIARSEIQIIRQIQSTEFKDEWLALSRGKPLASNSKLLGLQPKIDEDGLMRADGRLTYAEFLSYDVRFPVILPRRSWITKLIVKHFHEQGHHASGTNQTLASISTKYWIVSAREAIREWERECAECRRRKAKVCKQIMAPLPIARLKTSLRAFTSVSVDYGGPFVTIQGRGKRREKRYLCLFTCLATRAVHLEMAFALDTNSFLNALYRMVSRRGLPGEIRSDNGTNFRGADAEMKALVNQMDNNRIQESLANKGIKWTFNPPLAPHFGGVHETMIKSAKKAIRAILGNADVNDEELMTAIIGAESLINSRPLTYQTADPEDETPLTPNHFLHGQMGGEFAPSIVDETPFNPKKRWRRIQELVRHFWHRWMREWLPGLTARRKWYRANDDIKVGDVMLVLATDTARGKWPLGRVVEVYPGPDGHVRVAKVQVGRTTMVRAISKLCPLECDVPKTTAVIDNVL